MQSGITGNSPGAASSTCEGGEIVTVVPIHCRRFRNRLVVLGRKGLYNCVYDEGMAENVNVELTTSGCLVVWSLHAMHCH